MNVDDLIKLLGGPEKVTKNSNGWMALCPAHDDKKPSLSIRQEDNKVLVHCHAGCLTDAICRALGIQKSDLFEEPKKPVQSGKGKIVAEYPYHDENGNLLFEVVRFEPKDFRQRRPDGQGGWTGSTKGIRRVPFHLPQLIKAVKEDRPVYICEGEKDVLAMEAAGFAATCNAGGASKPGDTKWPSEFSRHFDGASVVIVADKDGPGRIHAANVAENLRHVAAKLVTIEVPDVDGKPCKDAADYFDAGGSAADLDELAEQSTDCVLKLDVAWLEIVEDGADIVLKVLPPVVEVVQGIIGERSKLVICSGSKAFKTWLTQDCSLSIAHGVKFLGFVTTRKRVLYCNLELKPDTFDRRIQAIAQAKGIIIDRGWFVHLPLRGRLAALDLRTIVSQIIALAKHLGAGVVVLDPVYKLNTVGDENSVTDQTVFFNELDRITTEAEATVILNDHAGKGNQSEKDPLDVIRGSSAKGGDLDAAFIIRKHIVEGCFRVDMVHRELPPVSPFTIGWEYPLMRLRPDLDPEEMKKARGGRRPGHDPLELVAKIADTDERNPISVSEWAERCGIARTTFVNYLPQIRKQGWIQSIGEGSKARQYVTELGRTAITSKR